MNGEERRVPIVLGLACLFIYLFTYSLLAPPLPSRQFFSSCTIQLDLRKLLVASCISTLPPLLSWGPIE